MEGLADASGSVLGAWAGHLPGAPGLDNPDAGLLEPLLWLALHDPLHLAAEVDFLTREPVKPDDGVACNMARPERLLGLAAIPTHTPVGLPQPFGRAPDPSV